MNHNKYTMTSDVLKNEAHVWFCYTDEVADAKKLDYYQSLLSADEKAQHQRFHFQKDQHSYLVSHALVRIVLSKYADLQPSQWQFKKNAYGRPEIKQSTTDIPLKFNLTHTNDYCACVVTSGMECGIDVEVISRKTNLMNIAQRMFASSEISSLKKLHDSEFRKAFFKFWTLRESYVKALGTGLAGSAKDFSFCVNSDDITISFDNTVNDSGNEKAQWQFALFEPTDSHIAAIAVKHSIQDKLTVSDKKIGL